VFPAHIAAGPKRIQHENLALQQVAFAASALTDYMALVATANVKTGKSGPTLTAGFAVPTELLSITKGDFTRSC